MAGETFETRMGAAQEFLAGGKFAEAEKTLAEALELRPGHPMALYLHGAVALQNGNPVAAVKRVESAVAAVRATGKAPDVRWLAIQGRARQGAGDLAGAVRDYGEALEKEPSFLDALFWRAETQQALGNTDAATDDLQRVVQLKPDYPRAAQNLGMLLRESGRFSEALAVLGPAVKREPENVGLLFNYGVVLNDLFEVERATAIFEKVVALDPSHFDGLQLLLSGLGSAGRIEEAQQAVKAGLAQYPGNPTLLNFEAGFLNQLGHREQALKLLRQVISEHPTFAPAIYSFSVIGGDMGDPSELTRIEVALAEDGIAPHDAASLHFAAGARLDKLDRADEAFEHYRLANEQIVQLNEKVGLRYDPVREERVVRELVEGFTESAFGAEGGSDSELPVFIVGMPRSGTTLVEQIIASHPDCFGAGEQALINQVAVQLRAVAGYPKRPPPQKALAPISAQYLKHMQNLAGDARDSLRITDKMPTNFRNLGLIARLFPNARVVHVQRNPLDTCLSCFFRNFTARGNLFTYSLDGLAHYYGLYEKLMAHWRGTLPLQMFELDYEELVEDQEGETRRLLDFLGLEWNEACLSFYKTDRPVLTASHSQVRQPIYKGSVGKWRRYEKQLAPLGQPPWRGR